MQFVREMVGFHGPYYCKKLTQNAQFVRKQVGFHGQVIDFIQLVRWKAGFSGQVVDFQSIVPRNRNGWGINARK